MLVTLQASYREPSSVTVDALFPVSAPVAPVVALQRLLSQHCAGEYCRRAEKLRPPALLALPHFPRALQGALGLQIALASAPATQTPTEQLGGPSGNKLFPFKLAPTPALQSGSTALSRQPRTNNVTFRNALRGLGWKVLRAV